MSPERYFGNTGEGADDPYRPDHWREGKHLPHWDGKFIPQSITFRLYDSIPKHVIQNWKSELQRSSEQERKKELHQKIQKYLDKGKGSCWLGNSEIANMVQDSLLYFDEDRYTLHAWVIMPNHVHVLVTIIQRDYELSDVLHSWRSYTAGEANNILDRLGEFWGDDYHDRYIRNEEHFSNVVRYIETNPVKAGLCSTPSDWEWSSAYLKSKGVF